MLFFLTGEIQIGKTRWLMRQIDLLSQRGVECCGVVAPGDWVAGESGFEKLGIDNMLLPERRTVPFARRRDLAVREGSYDGASQAAHANLAWAIDDHAIEEVNEHFAQLAKCTQAGRRLLVVDELGRLELLRNQGLTAAVALLDQGATPAFPHALVVVRSQLLETAHVRFAHVQWGGLCDIPPDEPSSALLLETA